MTSMIKNGILYSNFSDYKFKLAKAEGSILWDDAGNRLIDFTAGWNVANLGWNHPEVVEAFIAQASQNTYAPMWTADPMQEKYAAALLEAYPGMDTAIRVTGGTEANEVAIKLARAATGRKKIIGFRDTYHGQLFAALALGFRPEYVPDVSPLVPEFIQMDYPRASNDDQASAQALQVFETALTGYLKTEDVAAIVVEPGIVTGWGACRIAPEGFMETTRRLTSQYGTLMIIDEVGTGFSRTGRLFGIDAYDVVPDVATFAKGITNGVGGMGAVLTTAKLAEPTIDKASYVSTFGWTPTSCAAALKTLEIHQRDKVWERAQEMGDLFVSTLRQQLPDTIEVRGKGLEYCVDFSAYTNDAGSFTKQVDSYCLAHGLHVTDGGEGGLQIMPPCTISEDELREGIAILAEAITQTTK